MVSDKGYIFIKEQCEGQKCPSQSKGNVRMRIEIDKEEYKDLIETKEEFLKTVRKLDSITIENIKLTDKLKEKEQECEELTSQRDKFEFGNNILEHERNNYKHVLDKIEHQVTELFLGVENKDRTYCKKILDIINSVKDKNVPYKAMDGE